MTRSAVRPVAAGAIGLAVTALTWHRLSALAPDRTDGWRRRNYRDRDVTLLLGPAVAAGAVAASGALDRRSRIPTLVSVTAAAAVGLYDDRYGDRHARGLGGHLRALRAGRITTGLVKLVTIVVAAGAGARLRGRRLPEAVLDTVVVAGCTNLVNLFDLRPGRAAKLSLLAGGALLADDHAAAPGAIAVAVAAAALPADLGERAMLGDCGAGALGALLGVASAATRRGRRLAIAAGVVTLTLLSERVSFSTVIERSSALGWLDRLGRSGEVVATTGTVPGTRR